MKTVKVHLESISPYSASAHIVTPKKDREGPDDYERRTWRERLNVTAEGQGFIPPMAFKLSLEMAAGFRGEKIKGKGQATYTKHFTSGVMVLSGLVFDGVTRENVAGDWLFVPSDGKRGGSSRVMKCFPVVPKWKGVVEYHVLDDEVIGPEVFERTLRDAGSFKGVGRFRPERGGFYGRYKPTKFEWSEVM